MALTKVQSGFVDLTTSSGLSVGNGSSTTPALNFGTNTTGLFGDNDEVGISVGSSRILTAKGGNIGINNASPSQRLEVSGTTRTSYLTLPSPGSGNAAITVDSFNAGCLIRRNAGTGVGTSLGVLYSSAAPYLAYHMYANTNSGSYAEYPLKSSSSSSLTRSAILVNNYGVALGTGLEYNASVNEAIPHTHFRYNAVVNTDGNLVLNQHTNDNTGNRGIYFRITPNQTLPFSTLSKALINFKRTTTNARGQLDLVVDAGDDTNSVTVSDKPNLSLRTDKNVPQKFLHFATAADFGTLNGNITNAVSTDMAAGGRSYITLQAVTTNSEANSNDPAWISWKGSTSDDGALPCGGYSARLGGYRDSLNNGSTSIGFESVQNVQASPHTMQRNMTIRYDGRVAIGTNLNPNCALDISTHTTAINLPKGNDSQRPTATGSAGMLRWNTDSSKLEYSDGSNWSPVSSDAQIISTSGNTVTTSGDYKIHEFTSSGTFVNTGATQVAEVYVIGGGGGGGGGGSNAGSPGGGGGGMAYGSINIPNGSYTVTIGGKGSAGVAAGSNDGSSSAGTAGGTSSVVIGAITFQATGGNGGAGNSGSSNGGGSGFSPVAGGSGGTGTIGGGTSYSSPALRDNTPITSKYGTGGTGGSSGGLDGSGNGTAATDGSNGTNSGAGGGGGGDNKADNSNNGPAGEGGNGDTNFYTGGGGGGAADGDGNNTANLAQGGTGKHAGGNGGDFDTSGTDGGGPSGGSKGAEGSQRKNNGGGGGSYGGGGGGGADASNSHGAGGGQGGGGLVVIKYLT